MYPQKCIAEEFYQPKGVFGDCLGTAGLRNGCMALGYSSGLTSLPSRMPSESLIRTESVVSTVNACMLVA